MTRSDEMMLSAIRLKVAMQMNGRDVSVEGARGKGWPEDSDDGTCCDGTYDSQGGKRVNGCLCEMMKEICYAKLGKLLICSDGGDGRGPVSL